MSGAAARERSGKVRFEDMLVEMPITLADIGDRMPKPRHEHVRTDGALGAKCGDDAESEEQ